MEDQILQALLSLLPAIVVGGTAIYFFKQHIHNENKRRNHLLLKENQKAALPLRLQAYERMALFLNRISPAQLLLRVSPLNKEDKDGYANLLAANIDQEFSHNISQQIYVTEDCWSAIKASKNATIQLIRSIAKVEDVTDTQAMREAILKSLIEKPAPSDTATAYIRMEVSEIF